MLPLLVFALGLLATFLLAARLPARPSEEAWGSALEVSRFGLLFVAVLIVGVSLWTFSSGQNLAYLGRGGVYLLAYSGLVAVARALARRSGAHGLRGLLPSLLLALGFMLMAVGASSALFGV